MADRSLVGKVAIVTGSGRGLGKAIALALVQAGAKVTITDIDQDVVEQASAEASELGGDGCCLPIVADISEENDINMIVNKTIADLGGLHIVVNNAGLAPPGNPFIKRSMFWELDIAYWRQVVNVNTTGPFLLSRAAVPHLIEQGWGRLISVTTSMDTMLRSGFTPYGPSKAGHEALASIMSKDLEGTGITVNVVVPGGPADTRLVPDGAGIERSALIQPEVMGPPIVWLSTDDAKGVSGRRFRAALWDVNLEPEQAAEQSGAPIGWPDVGGQAVFPTGYTRLPGGPPDRS
jgi:NAD(P)-dependent dehydrogenase (short-subunit alcohol dehydrogenase family)